MNLKVKICMVGPDPKVMGGIASVVTGYLNSSMVRDYDLKYISSHKDGSKLKKLMVAAGAYLRFIWICIFNRPDIIHIHSSFGASFYRKMIFIIIGKLFSIPVVNHIHGSEFDKFYTDATGWEKRLIESIYFKCDIIVALSKEWKDKLEKIISGTKIRIVENFTIVPDNVAPQEKRENIIIFLGYIGERKGSYDILSVVKKVIAEMQDVKFLLCGNGEVEKLRKIVKENHMEKYIELTGWINNEHKKELLNRGKIYFHPSYNEGQPMSIIEGMAYGLPVISTNIGGIPSLITTGVNGYIFEPGSTSDFANAILRLLNDQNLCKRMYRNNIDKISNKYNLETNVRKISAIYNQIEKRKYNGDNQHRRIINRQSGYSGGVQDNK